MSEHTIDTVSHNLLYMTAPIMLHKRLLKGFYLGQNVAVLVEWYLHDGQTVRGRRLSYPFDPVWIVLDLFQHEISQDVLLFAVCRCVEEITPVSILLVDPVSHILQLDARVGRHLPVSPACFFSNRMQRPAILNLLQRSNVPTIRPLSPRKRLQVLTILAAPQRAVWHFMCAYMGEPALPIDREAVVLVQDGSLDAVWMALISSGRESLFTCFKNRSGEGSFVDNLTQRVVAALAGSTATVPALSCLGWLCALNIYYISLGFRGPALLTLAPDFFKRLTREQREIFADGFNLILNWSEAVGLLSETQLIDVVNKIQ